MFNNVKISTKKKLIAECEKMKQDIVSCFDTEKRAFMLGFLQGTVLYCAYIDKAYFKGLQAFIIENTEKGDKKE